MPLINLSIKHGQSLEEARTRLEVAVSDVTRSFGALIRRVDWAADRNQVRLEGTGFWVEMRVDLQDLHATGEVPILAGLLGRRLGGGLKQIVQDAFLKKLT